MRIVKDSCLIDLDPNPSPKCEPKASTYKYRDMEFLREFLHLWANKTRKQFLLYCLSGKILWHCCTFPKRCHGLFSLYSVASFRRISQIPDKYSNLPAIGIMIKQKTVSAISYNIRHLGKPTNKCVRENSPTEKTGTWGTLK